jgi:hypothetical protein
MLEGPTESSFCNKLQRRLSRHVFVFFPLKASTFTPYCLLLHLTSISCDSILLLVLNFHFISNKDSVSEYVKILLLNAGKMKENLKLRRAPQPSL